MKNNPIVGFQVDPAELRYIGQDLQRPECILAESDGTYGLPTPAAGS